VTTDHVGPWWRIGPKSVTYGSLNGVRPDHSCAVYLLWTDGSITEGYFDAGLQEWCTLTDARDEHATVTHYSAVGPPPAAPEGWGVPAVDVSGLTQADRDEIRNWIRGIGQDVWDPTRNTKRRLVEYLEILLLIDEKRVTAP